ncbi:hypothetical protein ZIOFF_005083 [Zingiber officinale]|uniref:RNA polymerase III RPC4 n=2 Tax=Zingiber officinale TaxID=94328 RepID=A0A8J5HV03_ZINOF|nr:hypothetical protein ZIOFF_005083 [Zingiber officinale]
MQSRAMAGGGGQDESRPATEENISNYIGYQMKEEQNDASNVPTRKMKFTPKIPPRRAPKAVAVKVEKTENKEDTVDKELLSKLNRAKASDGFVKRTPKIDKKDGPSEVAFGHGSSTVRSFPKGSLAGDPNSASLVPKEYAEPWDYTNSYYPTSLPLRRPYSGNPEILDGEEFGQAASMACDQAQSNPALELDLMRKKEDTQMLLFQLPVNLPLVQQSSAGTKVEDAASKGDRASKNGAKLELPTGRMGKIMVYKSGKVKMQLGDVLYDISPGQKLTFSQEVVAINTKEKHCCALGELDKRAVVTPDVDSLFHSLDDLDLH